MATAARVFEWPQRSVVWPPGVGQAATRAEQRPSRGTVRGGQLPGRWPPRYAARWSPSKNVAVGGPEGGHPHRGQPPWL